jgi:site-specific recombinase XerD
MRDCKAIPVEKIILDTVTRDTVLDFLKWLQENRRVSNSTRNYRLAAICAFVHYLQYEDIGRLEAWQQIMSIKALKTEQKSINYLTTEGIKLLLEQPDKSTVKGRRDLALLALMYDTGARVQEVIDLTPKALRINSKPYTILLFGKGRKSRVVPLIDEQVELLRKYLDENHLLENRMLEHPLFYNHRREKLTRWGVSYILDTYASMARGIKPDIIPEKISCHSLRHSKAMHLLHAGVNLVYIKSILGHSSIQTTDIYARADSKQKREALEKSYIKLTPNIDEERLWEHDKDLLEWLKKL